MPRYAWFAWYPADYRADTRHLTRVQHLAYREILDEIFLKGQHNDPPSIPDNDAYLAEVSMSCSADEWAESRAVLIDGPRALLQTDAGRISQKRMTHEIGIAKGRSEHGKTAADARWRDQKPKHGGNGAGNGENAVSDRQRLFLATRGGQWLDENRHLYVGQSDDAAFLAAFHQAIGISWTDWQRITRQRSN